MKKDAKPNLSTYNIIIDILCKANIYDDAYKVQETMAHASLFPTVMTINIMIDRLCKN